LRDVKACLSGVAHYDAGMAQLPTGENVLLNELGEKDVFVFDTDAALMQRLRLGLHDGVQHHSPIVGQERSAAFKERWISSNAKMFECADADDAIHRFIKLFPPLQPHINEA